MFQRVTSYINLILFDHARPICNLPVFSSVLRSLLQSQRHPCAALILFTLLHHSEGKQIRRRLKQPVLSRWQTPVSFSLLNSQLMSIPVPRPTPDCSPFLGLRMAMTGKREQRTRQELGKVGGELEEMKPAELLNSQYHKLEEVPLRQQAFLNPHPAAKEKSRSSSITQKLSRHSGLNPEVLLRRAFQFRALFTQVEKKAKFKCLKLAILKTAKLKHVTKSFPEEDPNHTANYYLYSLILILSYRNRCP